jgi:hypothetical protein
MNNTRRKEIGKIISRAEALRDELENIMMDIEVIRDEEEEYIDNVPENLQGTERYEMAEEALSNLESALEWFEEFDFEDMLSYLEEARM